jgi:hypothetical protein
MKTPPIPEWKQLEMALGDPDAPQEPYQKALTITSPIIPVYAKWLTCITRMYDDLVCANQWVVWWTNTTPPLYEEFSREEFNKRFVLESQAPAHMRERFAAMPSYLDWVDMHNADEDGVRQ